MMSGVVLACPAPCVAEQAATPPTANANESTLAQVRSLDGQSSRYFDAEEYELALSAMEQAQQLMPSSTRLYNMAVCHERLGHSREAVALFSEFIASPDAPVDRRARAVDRVRELEAAIEAESPTTPHGQATPPTTPEGGRRLSRTPFFVTLGVTAIVGVTAIALGAVALSLDHQFEDLHRNDQRAFDLEETGPRVAIATDVFIGFAAAAAVATAVLAVFTEWHRDPGSRATLMPATNGRDVALSLDVRF